MSNPFPISLALAGKTSVINQGIEAFKKSG
jgi:hypothetical protein